MIDVADKYTKHKKITRLYYVLRRVGFEIMRFRLTAVHDNLTQISAFFHRHIHRYFKFDVRIHRLAYKPKVKSRSKGAWATSPADILL